MGSGGKFTLVGNSTPVYARIRFFYATRHGGGGGPGRAAQAATMAVLPWWWQWSGQAQHRVRLWQLCHGRGSGAGRGGVCGMGLVGCSGAAGSRIYYLPWRRPASCPCRGPCQWRLHLQAGWGSQLSCTAVQWSFTCETCTNQSAIFVQDREQACVRVACAWQ
jgi:hypothetical protein